MKLSHPAAIKSAALLISLAVKAWFTTLAPRVSTDDPSVHPHRVARPTLYMFWHEMMLVPAVYWTKSRVPVLSSEHRDGELIVQITRMLGGTSIRGSTNKRGMRALRQMIRHAKSGHLAITPDGPRGPRRKVSIGSIYLASRAEMQIVPLGFAFSHCWRAKSWDRMAFPKPFGVVQTVSGSPILIPPDVEKDAMGPYLERVQAAMDDVQSRAERMVERYAHRVAGCSGHGSRGCAFTDEEADEHPARPLQQILVH
jgi:lysophospholipid acyltransferase (LPLAT)-like uncharacterized protein